MFITIFFSLLILCSGVAFAEPYNFTVIATDGDIIDGHVLDLGQQSSLSLPAINDSGDVVFTATFQGGRGLFSSNSAIVVEGDTVAGRVLTSISGSPDINANGTVVYRGGFTGGFGIFTQSDLLFRTGQVIGDIQITAFPQSLLSINDSGKLAVMVRGADLNTGQSSARVIDSMGMIAAPGDTIGGKIITAINENPSAFVSINNADQVIFQATFDNRKGIFSRTSFLTGEGESVSGQVIDSIAAQTALTGTGDAVFVGVFCNHSPSQCPDPVRAAVITQNQLLVTNGQVVGGDEITGFQVSAPVAVSENGRFVFSGSSTASEPGGGLYTLDGPVIRYPGMIAGRPANTYSIGPSSINDAGQIAFVTRFEDTNKWAVIRADPVEDSDADGLNDSLEAELGTNPTLVDTDGDGFVDGEGGIVSMLSYPDGVDVDGDGFVDGELDLGTDPTISNIGDLGPRGNLDEKLNLGDLVVLIRLVSNIIQPTSLESILGDINSDSKLNAADILLLQKAVLNESAH